MTVRFILVYEIGNNVSRTALGYCWLLHWPCSKLEVLCT